MYILWCFSSSKLSLIFIDILGQPDNGRIKNNSKKILISEEFLLCHDKDWVWATKHNAEQVRVTEKRRGSGDYQLKPLWPCRILLSGDLGRCPNSSLPLQTQGSLQAPRFLSWLLCSSATTPSLKCFTRSISPGNKPVLSLQAFQRLQRLL